MDAPGIHNYTPHSPKPRTLVKQMTHLINREVRHLSY